MKYEDVKPGARVNVEDIGSEAVVLTSPFNDEQSIKWIAVQWRDTGQVCTYPVSKIRSAPKREYCGIYTPREGFLNADAWKPYKEALVNLEGYLVRDKPGGKIRWEPCES